MINTKKIVKNMIGKDIGRNKRLPKLVVYPEKDYGEKRCVYTDEDGKKSITTYPEGMCKIFYRKRK